jgi:hypothetical protein
MQKKSLTATPTPIYSNWGLYFITHSTLKQGAQVVCQNLINLLLVIEIQLLNWEFVFMPGGFSFVFSKS